jgi:hypothetical protein
MFCWIAEGLVNVTLFPVTPLFDDVEVEPEVAVPAKELNVTIVNPRLRRILFMRFPS